MHQKFTIISTYFNVRDGQKSCSYCDWTTKALVPSATNWQQLKSHIETNHPEHGEKKHLCDFCGQGFIFESTCITHKKLKHETFPCHICGKGMKSRDAVRNHLSSVHNFEPKVKTESVIEFSQHNF